MQKVIFKPMSLDQAMIISEAIEADTNSHIVSFESINGEIWGFTFEENEDVDTEKEVSETTSELEYTDIDDEYEDCYRGTPENDDYRDYDDDITPFDPKSVCDIIGTCDGCGEIENVNAYHYCEYCWDDINE